MEEMTRKSRKDRKKKPGRRKKILIYTGLGVLVVLAIGAGVTAYEYNRLQPKNHFKNLQVVGDPSAANTTGDQTQQAGVFNMLLIGSDARPGDTASHTDSMVLIHADLNTHTYNMLSIPRDTRVYLKGYGYTKLTSVQYVSQSAHGTQQGIIDAVQAISNLTGVPINYYAETDYWGLQDLVDSIGGITMNLPFDVKLTHAWYKEDQGKMFTKGAHFLNGKMVTEIVHERYSLPGTDYGRQQLQEEALIGIAKAMLKPSKVTSLPTIAKNSKKFLIGTNMTTEDMMSLGIGVKGDFNPEQQIHYYQVKGKGQTLYDDILKANNDEIILDQNELKQTIDAHFK